MQEGHDQVAEGGDAAEHFARAGFAVVVQVERYFRKSGTQKIELDDGFQRGGEPKAFHLDEIIAEHGNGIFNNTGPVCSKAAGIITHALNGEKNTHIQAGCGGQKKAIAMHAILASTRLKARGHHHIVPFLKLFKHGDEKSRVMGVVAVQAQDHIVVSGIGGRIFKNIALGFSQTAVDYVPQHFQRIVILIRGQDLCGVIRAAVIENDNAPVKASGVKGLADTGQEPGKRCRFIVGRQKNPYFHNIHRAMPLQVTVAI